MIQKIIFEIYQNIEKQCMFILCFEIFHFFTLHANANTSGRSPFLPSLISPLRCTISYISPALVDCLAPMHWPWRGWQWWWWSRETHWTKSPHERIGEKSEGKLWNFDKEIFLCVNDWNNLRGSEQGKFPIFEYSANHFQESKQFWLTFSRFNSTDKRNIRRTDQLGAFCQRRHNSTRSQLSLRWKSLEWAIEASLLAARQGQ